MADHTEFKQLISAYFDEAVSPEEKAQVEAHIKECADCHAYWQDVQKLSSSLGSWTDETLSPDLEQGIRKTFNAYKEREERIMKKSTIKPMAIGATVAMAVIVCVVSMQVYTKRSIQARVRDASSYLTKNTPQLGTAAQYEPYYLESNYDGVSQKSVVKQQARPSYIGKSRTRATGDMQQSVSRKKEESSYSPYALKSKDKRLPEEKTPTTMNSIIDNAVFEYWGAAPAKEEMNAAAGSSPHAMPRMEALRSDSRVSKPFYDPYARKAGEERVDYYGSDDTTIALEQGYSSKGDVAKIIPRIEIYQPPTQEQYDRIYENAFLGVYENPLSTFSIDVDTASYSNVRRFLNQNQLPPKDSVRIEEMVNYFVYNYPQPKGSDPFSINTEVAPCPWNTNHQLALVGLQGKELRGHETPPSNLVFLIDTSGSMSSNDKLPLLKQAFKMMVQQLRPEESVSIVTYAGSAGLVLPATPGHQKHTILQAIDRLHSGGSTAGGAGIQLAYNVAQQNFIPNGNNRVILATDGDFNVGISNDNELTRLIEERRKTGVFLTVLGFGTGNYKDSKMEKIADKGNGNYYYIDTLKEGQKVLVHELGSTLLTIAKDVKIQIEFNPSQVKAYRLIGYENRILAKEDFNDDTKDAGELGSGHTVTAIYEIIPADSYEPTPSAGVDPLVYQKQKVVHSNDLMTVKLRYKKPAEHSSNLITKVVQRGEIKGGGMFSRPSNNLQWASAVAEFGLLLRDSQYKAGATMNNVLQRARQARGQDRWGYRAEFIRLVEKAGSLYTPPIEAYRGY